MALHLVAVCFIFLSFFAPSRAGAQAASVDLELVLAADVSGSIDARETALQRGGYLAAIRSPEFAAAVRAGPLGKIRLTYVEWAGDGAQQVTVPWRLVDGPEAAQAFADELAGMPAVRFRWGTSISSVLRFSAGLFEGSGSRRVIDISGDGPNNQGEPVEMARDSVIGQGITINGLPLMTTGGFSSTYDVTNLDQYYTDCVIGGPGAFMIPVNDWSQFPEAIRRKLVLELAGPLSPAWQAEEAGHPPVVKAQATPAADCLVGEKMWRDRSWMWDQR
jgi:hypothetical protein